MTLDLGDMTLTLCVSDGDGYSPLGALTDLARFLVLDILEDHAETCIRISRVNSYIC